MRTLMISQNHPVMVGTGLQRRSIWTPQGVLGALQRRNLCSYPERVQFGTLPTIIKK